MSNVVDVQPLMKHTKRYEKMKNNNLCKETFLYDLENDPHEKLNLIAEPEFFNVRKELSSLLKQRMIEAGESAPIIIPQDSLDI